MAQQATANGLDVRGYENPCQWSEPEHARALAAQLVNTYGRDHQEIVRNPHRSETWAWALVNSPHLIARVSALLGPDAAVENTFLVIKWPGKPFEVPAHQDGINEHIELDPARAVSCWAALTDATARAGCLEILPGSHLGGYLPFDAEPAAGAARGRALTVYGDHITDRHALAAVELAAGQALIFDTRLIHRSASNTTDAPRIGLNIRYATADAFRRGDPTERPGWAPLNLPPTAGAPR
ncbi:phytanoyl-CoA dioxygenase family protein [Nocardia brasiliensis]|uniref:phytanoyl-CoA dioxygenase family protein n=1 Tax=Nocardia brasiliensis TaxID=37326 RepID=UPI0036734912